MTRWRFNLYRDGEAEPFHSDLADMRGWMDAAGLPLDLAVRIRVALEDERVARVEMVRQVTR